MSVGLSGSMSLWLEHLLRAPPDAFSSSYFSISMSVCEAARLASQASAGTGEGEATLILSLGMLAPLPQFFANTLHSYCMGLQWINIELELIHRPL